MAEFRSSFSKKTGISKRGWPDYLAKKEDTPEDVQRRFVGRFGSDAFEEALNAMDDFIEGGVALDATPTANSKIMDFGCGWGRISKAASYFFEPKNITCVDIVPDALAMVESSGLPFKIVQSQARPPLPIDDDSFDMVVSYSVFSHLNETMANSWMKELHRVTKPGGIVAVTTRDRSFINWSRILREKDDLPPHAITAAQMFMDTEDCLRRYDAGEFVFDGEPDKGIRKGTGYGEACIPEGYAIKTWGKLFSGVDFVSAGTARCNQSIILGRK